jgi:hypothetical protein
MKSVTKYKSHMSRGSERSRTHTEINWRRNMFLNLIHGGGEEEPYSSIFFPSSSTVSYKIG